MSEDTGDRSPQQAVKRGIVFARQASCQLASNTISPESRMLLVGMAQAWLKLAQRAEQNPSAEILSETTSPPIVRAA
jgi:hypothetical protein